MTLSLYKEIIENALQELAQTDTIKELFKEYDVPLEELDLIPICFKDDLDVSARTEHAIISLNEELLEKTEEIPHYLAHEIVHYLQQTTGTKPTEGSDEKTYLDNKYEQEGFQQQSKFISETEGEEEAEEYIGKVLDHHDIKGKERKKREKQLLELAYYIWKEKLIAQ